MAIEWFWRPDARRIPNGGATIAENALADETIAAVTGGFNFGTEPIVPDCLVSIDDYIVPLA